MYVGTILKTKYSKKLNLKRKVFNLFHNKATIHKQQTYCTIWSMYNMQQFFTS